MAKTRKGNADCHLPNKKYRDNYDEIFGKKPEPEVKEEVKEAKDKPKKEK